jgi:serine/threonine-protein kinase RsbW
MAINGAPPLSTTVSGRDGGHPQAGGRDGGHPETGGQTSERINGVIGLRVPAAIAYRHLAIRLVSTACKMALDEDPSLASTDGDFEAEVVSAFGEAFNNIAVHGFCDLAPEPVHIEVDWDEEKLVITCVDQGHSFDPDSVALPDLDELPEHGMGLFIMRSCMDRIDYRPGPPNVLRLVKLRTRRGEMLPPPPSGEAPAWGAGHPGGQPHGLGPQPARAGAREAAPGADHDGGDPHASGSAGDETSRGSGVDLIPTHESCTGGTPAAMDWTMESSRRR